MIGEIFGDWSDVLAAKETVHQGTLDPLPQALFCVVIRRVLNIRGFSLRSCAPTCLRADQDSRSSLNAKLVRLLKLVWSVAQNPSQCLCSFREPDRQGFHFTLTHDVT
jgi:hypothetical protein